MANYQDVLDEFIGYSKIEFGQQRYNVVLGSKQRHYLDWVSTNYKKSRSSVIREALDTMSAADSAFKRYIRK